MQPSLSVRKIPEVVRLTAEARLRDLQIVAFSSSARSTVQERLRRAREAGATWPLPPECDADHMCAVGNPQLATYATGSTTNSPSSTPTCSPRHCSVAVTCTRAGRPLPRVAIAFAQATSSGGADVAVKSPEIGRS